MTKDKLFEMVSGAAAKGETVYVSTATRRTPVTPKTVAEWKEAGHDYFRQGKSGSVYMIGGISKGEPRYECIDFCRVATA